MNQANIPLEIFAAVVLILILFSCCLESKKSRQSICFIGMLGSNCLALITEAISLSLKGATGVDSLKITVSLISLLSGYFLCFCYVNYVHTCISQKQQISDIWLQITAIGGVLSTCCACIGFYNEWFFRIENGNTYLSEYIMFSMLYDMIGMALAMMMILKYRKALPSKDSIALLTLPGLMILAIFMQYFVLRKQSQLFVFTMLSCVVIYLMIQNDRIRRTAMQEKRMEEMHTQLMLSQIQPHFVFNALSSIRRLIQKDPAIAVEAVEQFSSYLRTNLDSLKSSRLVNFQSELEHVKEYLYLEKLRFGDRLRVEYDIRCDHFCLPVLTLQPIVENAVRHGILMRKEGGTVRITADAEEESFVIRIEDDGVGFDPDADISDGRTHVGITNVRLRLKAQCAGKMEIYSKIEKGTRVDIRLPSNAGR